MYHATAPPWPQAVRRADAWSEVLAEAKKCAAFSQLKLTEALLSMEDRSALSAAERRDERMRDGEMVDMHELIDGSYQPTTAGGAERADMRRKSSLPGDHGGGSDAHAYKGAMPNVFGAVRAKRRAARPAPPARAPPPLLRHARPLTARAPIGRSARATAQAMESGQ